MKEFLLYILVVAFTLALGIALPVQRAMAQEVPSGAPSAAIDLATKDGVALVKGEWRYSDTRIIEVDFKAAGADSQPTGAPVRTYDYTPRAGGKDFDDSRWELIDATTLDKRRGSGRIAFNWPGST